MSAPDAPEPDRLRRGEIAVLRADLDDLERQARDGKAIALAVSYVGVVGLMIFAVSGVGAFVVILAMVLAGFAVLAWKIALEQKDRVEEVRSRLEAVTDPSPPDGGRDGR